MTRVIAIVLALAAALSAEDKRPAADTDLKGKWEVTSATYNGNDRPTAIGGQLQFDKGEIRASKGGIEVCILKFTVDSTANPRRINMTREDGKSAPGIYVVEKEELKLCYRDYDDEDDGAPKAFESKAGDKVFVLVLKKVNE